MEATTVSFTEAFDSFLTALNDKFGGETSCGIKTFEVASKPGTKFIRIASCDSSSKSAYCFVAFKDGANKALGSWKAGDVFKPASWKGPAKTARGNIFAFDNGLDCCGQYSVAYLR